MCDINKKKHPKTKYSRKITTTIPKIFFIKEKLYATKKKNRK